MVAISALVEEGDTVAWSHGTGEPRCLTTMLVNDVAAPERLRIFCGVVFSDTIEKAVARHPGWQYTGIAAFGGLQRAARAGRLQILPIRWSALPRLIQDGNLRIDTALLNVGPCEQGSYSFGVAGDYGALLLRSARRVVVQVNTAMPRTLGPALIPRDVLDSVLTVRIEVDEPPLEANMGSRGVDRQIAENVATLIRDRDVLEVGIGSLGEAVWRALRPRRDLGVHTGMLTDAIVDLVHAGVVTNRYKEIDEGQTIGGVLFGSMRLYRFADRNDRVALHPITYTHNPTIIGALSNFVAVNFALQVDLTGQINSEVADGVAVGAVGGVLDFVEGAQRSPGGRSIFALRSRTRDGRPTIVPKLENGVVTVSRTMVDYVVTEYGCAKLTGATLDERVERLIAVAHPDDRAVLRRAADFAIPQLQSHEVM